MSYTEDDLPVEITENEYVRLSDGTEVRFEENGGARDVMISGDFAPRATLFPGNGYELECAGCKFLLMATDAALAVSKMA
jgi:hypothetical protein